MSIYQNDKLDYLRKSVESILNQTYSKFHFYLAFDGPVSVDIDNYISSLSDNRILLFRLKENGGLANALNYLLRIIISNPQYEYIARMDADDISMSERFELQRNLFQVRPEISGVGSWYQEINENGDFLTNRKLPVTHEEIRKNFIKSNPFAHSSVMFRRRLIEQAGYYPTNTLRLEDYVLWGNALRCGLMFANIPEYLLQFRRDKEFFKKRSGFEYGFNFITERFKMNKKLKAPVKAYLYSLIIGVVRMMPPFILRHIYLKMKKYQ